MPGAAQAVTLSISLPGLPVVSRGRSDGFARLLDDGAAPGAAEPGDKTPALPGAHQSGRGRPAVTELAAEAVPAVSLPTETAVAKKPAATDKGRQTSSPTRATADSRKPSHDSRPDAVAAAATVQPDASPAAPAVLPDAASQIATALPAGSAVTDHSQHAGPAVSALGDAPAGPTKHQPHQAAATAAVTEAHVANAVPQPTDASAPAATPTAAIVPAAAAAQAAAPVVATAAHVAAAQPPKADPVAHAAAPSPAPAAAPAVTSIPVAAHIISPQHLTIHLTPPELGKLEVRIDRPADAPARVEIKVEHAHTLDLLSQDQPRLQQALDQAGVPANRHLVLTLSDGGDGSGGSGGSQPDGRAAFAARRGLDASGSGSVETELPDHQPRWARSALDITA